MRPFYGKNIRHLDRRSEEHTGVSPLTERRSNYQVIVLFLINYSTVIFLPSFDIFSILAHENKKYLLEIKISLLVMRDKSSLNRNI